MKIILLSFTNADPHEQIITTYYILYSRTAHVGSFGFLVTPLNWTIYDQLYEGVSILSTLHFLHFGIKSCNLLNLLCNWNANCSAIVLILCCYNTPISSSFCFLLNMTRRVNLSIWNIEWPSLGMEFDKQNSYKF